MRRLRIYDRAGSQISMREFDELLGRFAYVLVARTDHGPYRVSTIWTGLPASQLDNIPLIFETMIFGEETFLYQRYATERQAVAGHAQAVAFVRRELMGEKDIE